MRISPSRREDTEDGSRISATIVWEDVDRPPFEMWFERKASPEPLADDLHPFLLGSIVPAWRRGERRLRVEGSICPRLRDGLRAATGLLSQWFSPGRETLAIEAAGGFHPFSRRSDRAALFLTGGVDSMHVLHANRAMFPVDHPGAFRDAVYAMRLAFLETVPSPRAVNLARRQSDVIARVSAAAGLEPVFVDSNFRTIESDVWLAGTNDHAALLAATAHAIAPRVGAVSLAASFDVGFLYGWGTHPVLDPLFSSTGVELRCEGYGPSRLEKVAAISGWPLARENLIVCFEGPLPEGRLNCGRCEKCLRTMVALLLLDALGPPAPFPHDIDASWLASIRTRPTKRLFWRQFPEPLRARGREDLAAAVERLVSSLDRLEDWFQDRGWKGKLRRVRRLVLPRRERSAALRGEIARKEPA